MLFRFLNSIFYDQEAFFRANQKDAPKMNINSSMT